MKALVATKDHLSHDFVFTLNGEMHPKYIICRDRHQFDGILTSEI